MEITQEIDLKHIFAVNKGTNIICSENFFDYLESNSTYVDKTGLIYNLIFIQGHILFTCPRRFGKTLNLSMIKCFFQPTTESKTHKKLKKKFEGLKIGSCVDLKEITTTLIKFSKKSRLEKPLEKIKRIVNSTEIINDIKKYKKMANEMKKNPILNSSENEIKQSILYSSLMEKIESQIVVWKNSEENEDKTKYISIIKKFGIVERYFGKYPVLSVSFKDISGNLEQVTEQLKIEISNIFDKNSSILKSLKKKLKENSVENSSISNKIKMFNLYMLGDISTSQLKKSLIFLSELLCENFGEKVYIIIDEYDRAVNKLFEEKLLTATIEDRDNILYQIRGVTELISDIIAPCAKEGVDSKFIVKIILTGIYNTLLKEAGSGVNNIEEYGVVDKQYSGYFGFTENEMINNIFPRVFRNYYGNEQKILQRFKKWYNGQLMGNIRVFTPSSVINYIKDLKITVESLPKQYWGNTGVSAIIKNINKLSLNSDLSEKMFKLSLGNIVKFNFSRDITLFSFFSNESKPKNKKNEKMITYLLVRSGYITRTNFNGSLFKIPAYEIKKSFVEKVTYSWLKKKYNNLDQISDGFKKSFMDSENFKEFLNEFVLANLKSPNVTESDFKSTIFGISLLSSMTSGNFDHIKSEVSTNNNKKIDTISFPVRLENDVVILHEYKKTRDPLKKEELVKDALWQIYTNMYMSLPIELRKKEVNKFWKKIKIRAIVFYFVDLKWKVEIFENEHSFEEAENIIKLFSKKGTGKEFLSNSKILKGNGKKKEIKKERHNFLINVLKWNNQKASKLIELKKSLKEDLNFFVNDVIPNRSEKRKFQFKTIEKNNNNSTFGKDTISPSNKKVKLYTLKQKRISSTSNGQQN